MTNKFNPQDINPADPMPTDTTSDKDVGGGRAKVTPFEGKLSVNPIAGLDNTPVLEKQPDYNLSECEELSWDGIGN